MRRRRTMRPGCRGSILYLVFCKQQEQQRVYSCRTLKRAIISVSPIYCDNVDMLTPSPGQNYTHSARAASLVRHYDLTLLLLLL